MKVVKLRGKRSLSKEPLWGHLDIQCLIQPDVLWRRHHCIFESYCRAEMWRPNDSVHSCRPYWKRTTFTSEWKHPLLPFSLKAPRKALGSSSVLPKVWVLCQPPLEVLVPLENAAGWYEGLRGVGRHLRLRQCKRGGEVVQTVQHLLGELQERVKGGDGGARRRDLLGQLLQGLHRHADLSHGRCAPSRDCAEGVRNPIPGLEAGDLEDGTGLVVGDEAEQLPHLAAARWVREGEIHRAAHAGGEGHRAQHEHNDVVHVLIVGQVEDKLVRGYLDRVRLDQSTRD